MKDLMSIGMIPEPIRHFGSHSHNVWEIVYYFYGTGVITVGETVVPFKPGVIVCLPPNVPHFEHSAAGFRNYHWCVFNFYGLGKEIPIFSDNENGDYQNILSLLYREYHLKQNNWNNITESLLSVLYHYMLGWNAVYKVSPLVERFCNTIVANISNSQFSIEEALNDFPVSPDHFRKIFKKELGLTPLEYLLQKRIGYSKKLLEIREINRYKIKEIAKLCGFDDQYYFSRLFKKATGVSPQGYTLKSN